jgi:hypothetical protein
LQVAQVCRMAVDSIPPDTPDMVSGEQALSPQFEPGPGERVFITISEDREL